MSILEISRSAGAAYVKMQPKVRDYLIKIQNFSNFSLVSLSLHPRSRRGAERIRQGKGRWSRPPKTALERSDLSGKFQFRESRTEVETKKTPDQIPVPSKEESLYINKGSAWAPAFASAHTSGRAGQHFDKLRCSCPIWHSLNFKVMQRV